MEKEIERGLISAFVNSNVESNYEFKPQFLTNDYKKGIKVLTTIEEELNRCDSFSISVAFFQGWHMEVSWMLKSVQNLQITGKRFLCKMRKFWQVKMEFRLKRC